jgi:hypothetical protein
LRAARIVVPDLVSKLLFSSNRNDRAPSLQPRRPRRCARTDFPELEGLPLGDLRARRAGAACAERRVMDKIHIEGLEKTYASKGGRIAALAQVNLTIRQNEFITLPWTP